MKKIMEAAKKHNVVMELNSYPDRLDLNDIHCRLAKEMGVMVAISTDPPTQTSREPEYSYSVSAPWTLSSTEISFINTAPTEFTFDFTNSPIPAGITDLYLLVVWGNL